MKQTVDLWKVKWSARFKNDPDDLIILAASATTAEKKARKLARKNGETSFKIRNIHHVGTIDVF